MVDANAGNADSNNPQQDALGAPPVVGGAPLQSQPTVSVAPTPTPAPPPTPAPAPEQPSDIQAEMNNILGGVKLPERHETAQTPASEPAKQYDTSLGAAAAEKNAARPLNVPTPQSKDALASVHTLKHDLQDVVQVNKMSLVRAAALEQEKKRPESIDALPAPRKKPIGTMIMALVFLLVLGGAALGGVYYISLTPNTPAAAPVESILFAESVRDLPIDGQNATTVRGKLGLARTSGGGTLGSITRLIPTIAQDARPGTAASDRPATFEEFMHAIDARPDDALYRALSSEFFLGLHTVDKNAPLLVVPVLSYDHAFAAMLAWEKTMNADLSPFFVGVTPLQTSTEGLVVERTFTDEIMRNYDVRALKDDTGQIILYYSFPTRSMLVIAESPYSFAEILNRLQAARRL